MFSMRESSRDFLKLGLNLGRKFQQQNRYGNKLPQHQLRAILQRLRQMRGLDLFTPSQVCNCS